MDEYQFADVNEDFTFSDGDTSKSDNSGDGKPTSY